MLGATVGGRLRAMPNQEANLTPKLLLSSREAARALSVSPRTLWSSTAPRGDLPSVKIGRCVRYHVADLERWIETRKEQQA